MKISMKVADKLKDILYNENMRFLTIFEVHNKLPGL